MTKKPPYPGTGVFFDVNKGTKKVKRKAKGIILNYKLQ